MPKSPTKPKPRLSPGKALDAVDRIMTNIGAELVTAQNRLRARNMARIDAILERVDDESARAMIRKRYGLRAPDDETFVEEDADDDVEVE